MIRYAEPSSPKSPSSASGLDRHRIAIVGYGEGAGRVHARQLRERGNDVTVAVLPGGMSWVNAVRDGFRPVRAWESVVGAEVVVLLVPDEDVEIVYCEDVAPQVREGALVIFAHDAALDADQLVPGVDVVVIEMQEGSCSVAVLQDATGEARARALAYLQWLGPEVPRPSSSATLRVHEPSDPFPHPSRRIL
jgi:ketol-acid reductoisomerase